MPINHDIYARIKENKERPFIVAEIGINHNGDMGLAKETISAAAEGGADSVKFQNYVTEDFLFNGDLMFEYLSNGKKIVESQYDMFKRCELSIDNLEFLKSEAISHGLDFHSTPTSLKGVDALKALDCHIVKNGSDYLSNLDLIEYMGASGMTGVLSTGMATISEIEDAVNSFSKSGNDKLIILQCTSSYPAPPDTLNLNQMKTIGNVFGKPVGFSDHSEGNDACIVATVLGARWIEKHFTLDKSLEGPDHRFSLDPKGLKNLVVAVDNSFQMLGKHEIVVQDIEKKSREEYTLSCVYLDDFDKGSVLAKDNIGFHRPGYGFRPKDAQFFIGRKLCKEVTHGKIIELTDFE